LKLTIAEIFNAREPMNELAKAKLPVKSSLSLLKLIRKLEEHYEPADKVKLGLVQTYGHPVENQPGNFSCGPADKGWPKFCEEFGELVSQEVEVVFEPVKLPDTLEISPFTLMALEKFITI